MISGSWQVKTKQNYDGVLEKWKQDSIGHNANPYIADVISALEFPHGRYKDCCLYSGIHATISAISGVVKIHVFSKLSICLSIYSCLSYIRTWGENGNKKLKNTSQNTKSRARSLMVSDLRSETKDSRFESGCYLCAEVSYLQ